MRRTLVGMLLALGVVSTSSGADLGTRPLVGPPLPPPSHGPTLFVRDVQSLDSAVAACVQADMATHDTPGASVAVLLDGEIVLSEGFGVKRRNAGDPVDGDTIFRIGSISKQMTAAAVMRLVDQGRVRLQDPVTTYLPDFELAGEGQAGAVTVWHLLTHTSGIPDTYAVSNIFSPMTLDEWLPHLGELEPFAPPGAFWNYSNPNFSLAGLILERVTGRSYAGNLQDLWDDAGMTRTTLDPDTVLAWGDYSFGHYTAPIGGHEIVYAPDGYDSPTLAPAGGVFSTAPDLVRWADALMADEGTLLRPALAREMQRSQVWTHYTPDLDYGYGIFSETFEGLRIHQHGGNISGWGAYLIWYPPERFAVAVLANTTESLGAAAYCITDAVLSPPPSESPDLSTDPATWRPYVGHYRAVQIDGTVFDTTVSLSGDALRITFERPDDPGFSYTTELVQAYLDTFLMDGNGDGAVDMDITFIPSQSTPGRILWLRNRYLVGDRQGGARPSLTARRPGTAHRPR